MSDKCTGVTAVWCPVHGDCSCQKRDDGEPTYDDGSCALHGVRSEHGYVNSLEALGDELQDVKQALEESEAREKHWQANYRRLVEQLHELSRERFDALPVVNYPAPRAVGPVQEGEADA